MDYFTLDELKTQFEELLRAYRDFHSLPEASRRADDNDDSDGDKQRSKKTAELAIETFRASFKERLDRTPRVLTSMPFDRAVGSMVEWASQLLPRDAGQESFSTIEACSSRLRELTSESNDVSTNGPPRTCWPFIQKLRVYLKAYMLSKGLIISDLPGLRDLNSARRAITERYVRQCHQILVVAKIDRAITDQSVKEIFELAGRVDLSKVDIVCTRSEDIQPREARHDWPANRAEIEKLQRKFDKATKDVEDLKEELEDFESDPIDLNREDEQLLRGLQRDYRKAENARAAYDFELRRHIIRLRNAKVASHLSEQYRNHALAATLQTFCISNKLYWDNRQKAATVATPYLELSGIIELRRYCIGIVAQSRLRATKEFIKDEIPALLGSVHLWIEAGSGNASAEQKQRTLDAVSDMQRELNKVRRTRLS